MPDVALGTGGTVLSWSMQSTERRRMTPDRIRRAMQKITAEGCEGGIGQSGKASPGRGVGISHVRSGMGAFGQREELVPRPVDRKVFEDYRKKAHVVICW